MSFGHPRDWAAQRRTGRNGAVIVTSRAPQPAGDGTPVVELRVLENLQGSFDVLVESRRDVRQGSGTNRSEEREELDLEGAEQAILYQGTVTIGETPYDSADLAVLTDEGAAIFLSAEVAQGGDADVDDIVRSLRLG